MNSFIHLNVHSEYSISDGIVRLPDLMASCKNQHMPAVAITDQSNLFGSIRFYKNALKSGIKPIIGADIWTETQDKKVNLILLCMNSKGYMNLKTLVSESYLHGQQASTPIVPMSLIEQHHEGLIALHGWKAGPLKELLIQKNLEAAKTALSAWKTIFPERFYFEVADLGTPQTQALLEQTLQLCSETNTPAVATNCVCFTEAHDFEAHEARVCIHDGRLLSDPKRPKKHSPQQYFKSSDAMTKLFSQNPSLVSNTMQIAMKCNLTLSLDKPCLPQFPSPTQASTEDYFEDLSLSMLSERLRAQDIHEDKHPAYLERLHFEMGIIRSMGFPSYFLIVADFINWAKSNTIPVGPGRGSGAGSLVAYALGITDLDPLEHELLFERFLNPERVSMPDFDIDFCMDRRDEVIQYVMDQYGRDAVSQIITFGRMAAKAVVRDCGRVMGLSYGFVDKIAKLIPFEIGMTLEKALLLEPQLEERYLEEEEVKELINLAKKLEGVTRNAGKHAGGVVIAPTQLTDFTALYCEADGSNLVTQLDKDDVESAGLVKFDFLGLRTLTIIQWTLESIARISQEKIAIEQIPLDDKASFDLLKQCQTTAVFQLESRGMKELISRLQPDCFEEITALVALFRPGPLQSGMVDDFIDRKHGRAKIIYPHPWLEDILKPTYGVILYQEQVMQIAQKLSGYSLGQADLLRRAMGKKKAEEMAKQRSAFVTGAEDQSIDGKLAGEIFDIIEKFAGYGFNKSHSAAYALIAYQTAWLKTHYPNHFMSAVLSSDMDNTDKVVNFIDECKQMRLKIIPPSIHASEKYFHVNKDHAIVFGLGAIKGVGENAIDAILEARHTGGLFTSLFDLCKRVDGRKMNRKVLEALIKSGALDCFKQNRATLVKTLDKAIQTAEQEAKNQAQGQSDLFGMSSSTTENSDSDYSLSEPTETATLLKDEKITLGFYLSGHPMDAFQSALKNLTSGTIQEVIYNRLSQASVAGIVQQKRVLINKKGKKMAFLSLEDHTGSLEVAIFSDTYEEAESPIHSDQPIVIQGEISQDKHTGNPSIQAKKVQLLSDLQCQRIAWLTLKPCLKQCSDVLMLQGLLKPFTPGRVPVRISLQHHGIEGSLQLSQEWNISLSPETRQALEQSPLIQNIDYNTL